MALVNQIDVQATGARLQDWLRERLPGAGDLVVTEVITPSSSGVSSQMVVVTAERAGTAPAQYVARIEPPGEGIMRRYDLEREYTLMRTLDNETAVPLPRIVGYEADSAVIGSPFMVMEHVEGRTPGDMPPFTTEGWVLELSSEQRSTLYDNALAALAEVHRVDWKGLGLTHLERPGDDAVLDRQLRYWRDWFEWASAGEPHPVIEAGLDRLERTRPAEPGPTVLTWGDARIGNMIFADDMSVAAVLDWECATLAEPEYDLGWWLFCGQFHTEALGVERPGGFPTDAEVISRYEDLTRYRVREPDYYRLLGGVQFCVYVLRQANLLKSLGMLPQDDPLGFTNPAVHLLARLLDMPAPEQSTAFRLS